METMAKKMNQK